VFGRRAKLQGISSPFSDMKSAVQYGTYNAAKKALNQVAEKINKIGFNQYRPVRFLRSKLIT
jgi:hypothetical protein